MREVNLQTDTKRLEPCEDTISRQAAIDALNGIINRFEQILRDIRESKVDDSVCGLCEYDGAYIGQSGDWCNECPGFDRDDCFKLSDKTRKKWTDEIIKALPSAQPEITLESAIDYLHKIGWMQEHDRVLTESAQPESQWIPCSERLPEEGHDVLITKKPFELKGYEQYVIKAKRSADPRSGKIEWWSPEFGTLTNKAVLAWMHLPEPWKGESNEL